MGFSTKVICSLQICYFEIERCSSKGKDGRCVLAGGVTCFHYFKQFISDEAACQIKGSYV